MSPLWNVPSSVGKMFPGTHQGWKGAQPTPRQIPARPPGANIDTPPCSCVAQSSTIPGGATLTAPASTNATAAGSSFCSADQRVECTIDTWTLTGSADIQVLELMARCTNEPAGLDDGGYVFYLYTQTATLVTMGLAALNQFGDIATPLTGQVAPINGDVFELIVVGTAISAKKNGSTILSATDSSITDGQAYGVSISADNVHPTVVTGCTIETFC